MTWDLEVGMTGTSKIVQQMMPQVHLDIQTRTCKHADMDMLSHGHHAEMQPWRHGHADMQLWTCRRRKAGTKTKILPKAGTSILEYFFFEFSQEKFEAGKDTFWAISGDLGARYYLI